MSLNGLDDVKVKEAHEAAVAEPGRWYVLSLTPCGPKAHRDSAFRITSQTHIPARPASQLCLLTGSDAPSQVPTQVCHSR